MISYLELSNAIDSAFDKYILNRDYLINETCDCVYGKEVRRNYFDEDYSFQEEKYSLETWQIEITFEEFQILHATLPHSVRDSEYHVDNILLEIRDNIERFETKKFINELKVNSKEEVLENRDKYVVYHLCDWTFIKDETNGMFCDAGNKNKITLVKYAKVLPVIPNHDAYQADEEQIKLINGIDARNLTEEEQIDLLNRLGYNVGTNIQPTIEVDTMPNIDIRNLIDEEQLRTLKEVLPSDEQHHHCESHIIDEKLKDKFKSIYNQGILDTIEWLRSPDFYLKLSESYLVDDDDIKNFLREKNIDDKDN